MSGTRLEYMQQALTLATLAMNEEYDEALEMVTDIPFKDMPMIIAALLGYMAGAVDPDLLQALALRVAADNA